MERVKHTPETYPVQKWQGGESGMDGHDPSDTLRYQPPENTTTSGYICPLQL